MAAIRSPLRKGADFARPARHGRERYRARVMPRRAQWERRLGFCPSPARSGLSSHTWRRTEFRATLVKGHAPFCDVIICPAALPLVEQNKEARSSGMDLDHALSEGVGAVAGPIMQTLGSRRAISGKARPWRKGMSDNREHQPIGAGDGPSDVGIACSKTDVPQTRDVGRKLPCSGSGLPSSADLRTVAGSGMGWCYGARGGPEGAGFGDELVLGGRLAAWPPPVFLHRNLDVGQASSAAPVV